MDNSKYSDVKVKNEYLRSITSGYITASTNNLVTIERLGVKTLGTGTSVTNLGIDSNGNVVSGVGGVDYWSSGSTGVYSIKVVNDSNNDATGDYAYSEGVATTASNTGAHAEGNLSTASGVFSHAQNYNTIAQGEVSHAEGEQTTAIGIASHSEGSFTTAQGNYSHAGGTQTIAIGERSFVHGTNSVTISDDTIVLGANITGYTANRTYVDGLNIKDLANGNFVTNIGLDENGYVVSDASNLRPSFDTAMYSYDGVISPYIMLQTSTSSYLRTINSDFGYKFEPTASLIELEIAFGISQIAVPLNIPIKLRIQDIGGIGAPTINTGFLLSTSFINVPIGTRYDDRFTITTDIPLDSYSGKTLTINTGNFIVGPQQIQDVQVIAKFKN